MDHFQQIKNQITNRLFVMFLVVAVVGGSLGWLMSWSLNSDALYLILAVSAGGLSLLLVASWWLATSSANYALEPLRAIRQAILHVSQNSNEKAPDLKHIKIAGDLVTTMAMQVYELASQAGSTADPKALVNDNRPAIKAESVIDHLPLPLFALDKKLNITVANRAGIQYAQSVKPEITLLGQPFASCFNLSFAGENSLSAWMADCQANKVWDSAHWERVKIKNDQGKTVHQCDIAAEYNRDNAAGADFTITMLERSKEYDSDDQSLSFIALVVHELRTPLTFLRGYIEVFEDEFGGKLTPELTDFMHKMQISANQLTAFVNNILRVAKIDSDQLSLTLTESQWEGVINKACSDMQLRAQLNNQQILVAVAPNLPSVAIDPISMYEVLYNLLDNAIKYNTDGQKIIVSAQVNKDGQIQTTVQDFGLGIPASVLPNLFEKFYRNHRTRSQVTGSGLGLYLCKAIVGAHGGQIWAQSKEGEGSTFGFTLQAYSQLAAEHKNSNNKEIVRNPHGWIKNHSLYKG